MRCLLLYRLAEQANGSTPGGGVGLTSCWDLLCWPLGDPARARKKEAHELRAVRSLVIIIIKLIIVTSSLSSPSPIAAHPHLINAVDCHNIVTRRRYCKRVQRNE
jgi:hypothetical protein